MKSEPTLGSRPNRHALSVPLLVLAAVAGMSVLAFLGLEMRANQGEIFRFQAGQIGERLYRDYLVQGRIPEEFPPDIRGFGIYDPQGSLVQGRGAVPGNLDPRVLGDLEAGGSLGHRGKSLYQWLAPLVPPAAGMRMMDRFRPTRRGQGLVQGMAAQGYLLILIDHKSLTISQGLWLLFAVMAPLAWLAFLWTSRQVVEGRRRHEAILAHNRELLQLAETSRTLNHEIRNPLAAILLQTAVLKRRWEGPAPQEIRIIEAEVRRIEGLMDRVRDFLRDPRGRQVPVSVWPFLRDLALRFPPDLRLYPPEDPGVWASLDPERFRSVVENLVRNARECGPDPQVEIMLESGRQKLMVTVLDRGPGLGGLSAEEVMAPFFTTKPQGSGLGLALARSFVEAQGGTLSLLPREGGGLAARLELPRVPAPDA